MQPFNRKGFNRDRGWASEVSFFGDEGKFDAEAVHSTFSSELKNHLTPKKATAGIGV